jgi:carbonic anhydrase
VIGATEALERLREGNRRYAEGRRFRGGVTEPERRQELMERQAPFAVVLGCSDSRVPAEIVFDQGVGELFVIRVAGNIVNPTQLGSVEFAVERLGSRLVVVLGHSSCGAVEATIEALETEMPSSPNLRTIVEGVRPAVEPLLPVEGDRVNFFRRAVRANIRAATEAVRTGLCDEPTVRDEGVLVVGAEYSLATGVVDFFLVP